MGIAAMFYGLICYGVFLLVFLYAVCFVENIVVPKTIDSGAAGPIAVALVVNALLLGLFAVQHSVMARQGFKESWTKIVPRSVERSTYVLISSLLLSLLFWQWRPIPQPVWEVEAPALRTVLWILCAVGWLTLLASTFMINHFDLFGLRQVYLRMVNKPYTHLPFTQTLLYKYVRHPLYLGFLIAFWATPSMSLGHLLFAVATTGYILVGVTFEERDLVRYLGEPYVAYRKKVPMLFPLGRGKGS